MAEQNVNQQEVMNALGTLAKAAVGAELAALRQSVASLEASLSQRLSKLENDTSAKVAAAAGEAAAGLAAARQETGAGLEELRQAMARAEKSAAAGLGGLSSRLEKAMGEMEQKAQKASEQAAASMASARDAIRKDLASLSQEVGQQFEAIETRLATEAQARAVLEKEQWRVSTVLRTFAGAFSGSSEPPEASPRPAGQAPRQAANSQVGQPRQTPPEKGDSKKTAAAMIPEDIPDSSEVSSSLDKLFEPTD